jgi:hypothetical protein
MSALSYFIKEDLLQNASSKQSCQTNLLLSRGSKFPDAEHGEDKNHTVGYNINRGCRNKDRIDVDTVSSWQELIPAVFSWVAGEQDNKQI